MIFSFLHISEILCEIFILHLDVNIYDCDIRPEMSFLIKKKEIRNVSEWLVVRYCIPYSALMFISAFQYIWGKHSISMEFIYLLRKRLNVNELKLCLWSFICIWHFFSYECNYKARWSSVNLSIKGLFVEFLFRKLTTPK